MKTRHEEREDREQRIDWVRRTRDRIAELEGFAAQAEVHVDHQRDELDLAEGAVADLLEQIATLEAELAEVSR